MPEVFVFGFFFDGIAAAKRNDRPSPLTVGECRDFIVKSVTAFPASSSLVSFRTAVAAP